MGKQILIVDDSSSMRQMVGFTLRGAGYDVVEAVDGTDALAKLQPTVQMVLTDLNMPNLDGLGLIRAVRAGSTCKFVPIVMLTTESEDAKKAEGSTRSRPSRTTSSRSSTRCARGSWRSRRSSCRRRSRRGTGSA